MKWFDPDLTWTCHVCGEERPDDKISVFKSTVEMKGVRIPITQNVRYCNDRQSCIEGAPNINFVEGVKSSPQ